VGEERLPLPLFAGQGGGGVPEDFGARLADVVCMTRRELGKRREPASAASYSQRDRRRLVAQRAAEVVEEVPEQQDSRANNVTCTPLKKEPQDTNIPAHQTRAESLAAVRERQATDGCSCRGAQAAPASTGSHGHRSQLSLAGRV
jgi:hypothetical protein